MKKALIFQNRIVDVVDNEFPVSPEMVWIDVDDDVTTRHQYNEDGTVSPEPAPSIESIREQRNFLLSESDWVVTKAKELGTNIPAAWKEYRQALRDLPANTTDTWNPPWPTKPS